MAKDKRPPMPDKPQLPTTEVNVGNTVIFLEDIVTRLLNDPNMQKLAQYGAIVQGCNRLLEGKFWLTASLSSMQQERTKQDDIVPPMQPKKR